LNINTITSIEVCVDVVSQYIGKKDARDKACEYLGVEASDCGSDIDDVLSDMKLRVQMLQWDMEKKKLGVMEQQLKDLRSEDLKTSDALDDIVKNLG